MTALDVKTNSRVEIKLTPYAKALIKEVEYKNKYNKINHDSIIESSIFSKSPIYLCNHRMSREFIK